MTRARLLSLLLAIASACAVAAQEIPQPPDASASDFSQRACTWAGNIASTVRADDLERELFRDPSQLPPALRAIGEALASPKCTKRTSVSDYAVALARATARRLSAAGAPWTNVDIATLLAYQLVDPVRFAEDAKFRHSVLPLIPHEMEDSMSRELRARQMEELNEIKGFGFDSAEKVEAAWQLVPRASTTRRFDSAQVRIPDDYASPVEATVFVLPSRFFSPASVETFLHAQRNATPQRRLVVITDEEMKRSVERSLGRTRIEWIDSFGRAFTPWPRDPFTVARRDDGGVVFLTRPNLQEGREEDSNMARQIIAGSSESLDRALGQPQWTVASTPFHNGQVLLTPDAAWVSIHALEVRNLERMHRAAIPRKQFDTTKGIDDYLALTRQSIAELEKLYGRKVRLVHPVPDKGKWSERRKLIDAIYGGGDFDLDSVVTLVPKREGKWTALVADPSLNEEVFRAASADEWERFRAAYGLAGTLDVPQALTESQSRKRARGLDAFVDLIARSLAGDGFEVQRIPLLLVPVSFLADTATLKHSDFVVGWNNVVFERTDSGGLRANAFASLLDSADRRIVEQFRAAGVDLQLLPPLVRSVILNGGYRCASNNVRAAAVK